MRSVVSGETVGPNPIGPAILSSKVRSTAGLSLDERAIGVRIPDLGPSLVVPTMSKWGQPVKLLTCGCDSHLPTHSSPLWIP
jgi:hypothetical protein